MWVDIHKNNQIIQSFEEGVGVYVQCASKSRKQQYLENYFRYIK